MLRLMFLTVGILLATLPASAQDWAKERLAKSPRHQEWVKVKHGDRTVQCFVVYPEVKAKATAVVLIHEIFGLSDWARSTADEVAEAGYIAIAPDLLSGMGPGGGGTSEFPDQDAVIKAVFALPAEQVTADLKAATDYVTKLSASNGKAAAAGFCWGGGQSFQFAADKPSIKAAFVFYGTPPTDEAVVARIGCPVYGFYGGNDARVTSTVPAAEALTKKAHKKYAPVIYAGAGHGFMRAGEAPDANDANKKARQEAWARWKSLLKKI